MKRFLAVVRGRAGALAQVIGVTELHLYGGVVLGAIGGELIWPGLGFVAAGAALFWLAIRKVN